jgi:hypothetical protein
MSGVTGVIHGDRIAINREYFVDRANDRLCRKCILIRSSTRKRG